MEKSKKFNWKVFWYALAVSLAVFAFRVFLVMILLSYLATEVSWVPALGYWTVFGFMVIIEIVVDSNKSKI